MPLPEDADSRRSYHLGLTREALQQGKLQEARSHCEQALEGATEAEIANVGVLHAEVLQRMGAAPRAASWSRVSYPVNLFLTKLVRISGFSSLFSAIAVFLSLSGKFAEKYCDP